MARKSSAKSSLAGVGNISDRSERIELMMAAVEKQFGKGSIMRLGEDNLAHGLEL